jgi:hypothetical protein
MLWLVVAAALVSAVGCEPAGENPCQWLTSLSLPNTSVARAQAVPARQFIAPDGRGGRRSDASYNTLPALRG